MKHKLFVLMGAIILLLFLFSGCNRIEKLLKGEDGNDDSSAKEILTGSSQEDKITEDIKPSMKKVIEEPIAKCHPPNPILGLTPDSGCPGDRVADASGTTFPDGIHPTTPYRFEWSDGFVQSGTSITCTHSVLAVGTFWVELTAKDKTEATTKIKKYGKVVTCPPEAKLGLTPDKGCLGQEFTADATGTNFASGPHPITPYTFEWSDGYKVGSKSITCPHTPTSVGPISVTLIAMDKNGSTSTLTKTSVVENCPGPVLKIIITPEKKCVGESVLFRFTIVSGGPVVWQQWSGDDGILSNSDAITHIYHAEGVYNIKLEARNATGITGTASAKVVVVRCDDSPIVEVSLTPLNECLPHTFNGIVRVVSNPNNLPISAEWMCSCGFTSKDLNISHTHAYPTTENILVRVTSNGNLLKEKIFTVVSRDCKGGCPCKGDIFNDSRSSREPFFVGRLYVCYPVEPWIELMKVYRRTKDTSFSTTPIFEVNPKDLNLRLIEITNNLTGESKVYLEIVRRDIGEDIYGHGLPPGVEYIYGVQIIARGGSYIGPIGEINAEPGPGDYTFKVIRGEEDKK
ncbi:MAG: PKD domain-containing protein [Candidatus Nanoarchaeia archaeon]|nr:PKD domain-containing protein [Candidatus Nanoarchaeia archaeon]